MNYLDKHITFSKVNYCPKCHQNDFILINERLEEAWSIDKVITTIIREVLCSNCNLGVIEALSGGEDSPFEE